MIADRDPESAHDVQNANSEKEQQNPNRQNRRKHAKIVAKQTAANKARAAKEKEKRLTKAEMIEIARARQGLPPVLPLQNMKELMSIYK